MGFFSSIDLSELPPPSIVEELDYETLLAAIKSELQKIAPQLDVDNLLESDPISKLLQVIAYREMHLRQRINESAQGVMLATATGANLDNLAALVNIQRLVIDPGDPEASIDPIYEGDARLRARTQLAFEGFSTAGPSGAYVFHALSASALVKDVQVYSELPGEVEVRILSSEGNGQASEDLLARVKRVLNADEVRPITDLVQVNSADIIPYSINATLILSSGIGAQEVLASARAAAESFVKKHHKLGADIARAGLLAALYQPGVQNVILHQPQSDIAIERNQAPYGSIGSIDSVDHPTSAPANMAAAIAYDTQSSSELEGTITVTPAIEEHDITHYVIYWGGSNAQKLPLGAKIYTFSGDQLTLDHDNVINLLITSLDGTTLYLEGQDFSVEKATVTALNAAIEDTSVRVSYALPPIVELKKSELKKGELEKGSDLQFTFAEPTPCPIGATHLIVFTKNEYGEMLYGVSTRISILH